MAPTDTSDSTVVFVGQLPFTATVTELHEFFSKFGEVKHVRMSRKTVRRHGKVTHLFTGVAHVEFSTHKQAVSAVSALDQQEHLTRKLRADLATGLSAESQAKRAPRGPTAEPSDVLFLGNLPYEFDVSKLEELVGTCKNVVAIRTPELGLAKGWAYVQFKNVHDAEAAVKILNGALFKSRPIRVDFANTNQPELKPASSTTDDAAAAATTKAGVKRAREAEVVKAEVTVVKKETAKPAAKAAAKAEAQEEDDSSASSESGSDGSDSDSESEEEEEEEEEQVPAPPAPKRQKVATKPAPAAAKGGKQQQQKKKSSK